MPNIKTAIFAFIKRYKIPVDRNVITYIICIVIATVLWFLNALNKDYTAEISYPVKYTNFPKGKFLVSELPQDIILEVRANGFALLGYKISTSFLPITFNVNAYSNHMLEKSDVLEYTLNTQEIKDKISSQLNSEIKLLNIFPETIDFRFSKQASKTVAIAPLVRYTLRKQYILRNAISTEPDSILVSGPEANIDTLRCVYTQPITLKELDNDISRNVTLGEIPGINYEQEVVKVSIQIERFTEAKKTIPISVENLPDSLNIRLFPNHISLTYNVGLSKYDRLLDTDFTFIVDYNQCSTSSLLTVKARKIPPFIGNLAFSPQKVEYILERK